MNDITAELAKLHNLTGAESSRQVELIANMQVFHLIKGERDIFSAASVSDEDYDNLIRAARKLLDYGYRVIMNMATNYDARQLGKDIRQYFVLNPNAVEVMIFKGTRQIIIKRSYALSATFVKVFMILH